MSLGDEAEGRQVIACNAAYGEGGMGKHLAFAVEQARGRDRLDHYFCTRGKTNDPEARVVAVRLATLLRSRWLSNAHAWRESLAAVDFDLAVASRLQPAEIFVGFAGRSLHSLRRARRLGFRKLVLHSGTPHIAHVALQHQRARTGHRLEKDWLSSAQIKRTLKEYADADTIAVPSEYARQTFLGAGVPPGKLRRISLPVERRYAPPSTPPAKTGFHIVYVGQLTVAKGLPLLLDAFELLRDKDAVLTLVGGFATDAMQKYVRRRIESAHRIHSCCGDPLPYLHRADVLVHPSYVDGLGLAPLEALACGVPVIVSEDTGMKEMVTQGTNGFVVPTGNVAALVERLREIRERPLKGTFAALQTHAA